MRQDFTLSRRSAALSRVGLIFSLLALLMLLLPAAAVGSPNVKLDLFRDCDIGGCSPGNPLDMQGPGGQGFVNYNQDDSGDLRVVVHMMKSGAPNSTYTVFLVCGPGGIGTPHSESCGFTNLGSLSTNGKGNATSEFTIPKCTADALISGNAFTTGQQAHIDILKAAGDQSLGGFVATALDFDPTLGPACP